MSPMKENIHDKLKKRKLTLGLYKNACGSGGNEKTLVVFSSTASRTLLF